jgi:hypothetical protein
VDLVGRFEDLWNSCKSELFRLQLLNEYIVEEEKGDLDLAREGKWDEIYRKSEGWFGMLKQKRKEGVRNINLQVVDIPFTEYTRMEAGFMMKSEEFGRESFFVERKEVSAMVGDFEDYWMFDRKTVLVMKYDKGRYLGSDVEISDPETVRKYVELEENLLKKTMPLRKFLAAKGMEVKY